jgi:hypothetical protein
MYNVLKVPKQFDEGMRTYLSSLKYRPNEVHPRYVYNNGLVEVTFGERGDHHVIDERHQLHLALKARIIPHSVYQQYDGPVFPSNVVRVTHLRYSADGEAQVTGYTTDFLSKELATIHAIASQPIRNDVKLAKLTASLNQLHNSITPLPWEHQHLYAKAHQARKLILGETVDAI